MSPSHLLDLEGKGSNRGRECVPGPRGREPTAQLGEAAPALTQGTLQMLSGSGDWTSQPSVPGTKQGRPFSPLVFNLVLEVVASPDNKKMKGIPISKEEVKLYSLMT